MKFTSKVLSVAAAQCDAYNSLRFPLYANAAYEFSCAEDIEAAFKGTKPAHAYSRSSNPTVNYFEKTITAATDSLDALSFSSGMAAISSAVFALCKTGDEIVCSNKLFGTTVSLFNDTFRDLGIKVNFVDFSNIEDIKNAITARTKILFFETITNPHIHIFDIEKIVEIGNNYKIPTIADITATPPYMFDAKKHGIHISVISSTKFISGGGTSIGGILIDYGLFDWSTYTNLSSYYFTHKELAFMKKLRSHTFRNIGACLSPQAAYFFSLGIETMELRIDRACSNAQKIAEFLENHSNVLKVNYPGLSSNNFHNLSKKYFNYPGSIVSFELENQKKCFELINNVKLIRRATNLHDNKSLIIHPHSTIYSEFPDDFKHELQISDKLIRLSVGIENIEDIIADLHQALLHI